jgi:hypothetical protein
MGICAACTGYGRIIDAIQTAGEGRSPRGGLTRTEPRRHSFFGEEFGLRRNPAFASSASRGSTGQGTGHGIGQSIARQGGAEQTLGDKPFVDDMRVPGMLHGAMVLTEHLAHGS